MKADRLKEIPVPQNEQNVTRYSLLRTESGRTTMQPFEHGLYVKYVDHKRAMSALSQPVPQGEQSLPPQLVEDAILNDICKNASSSQRLYYELATDLKQLRAYVRKGNTNE